jgi:hypothetical protein
MSIMVRLGPLSVAALLTLASAGAAQDVRQHTRPQAGTTSVSAAQAETLTLTVGSVASRLIQIWIRTAGTIDPAEKVLSVDVSGPEAGLVSVGQRVRAFPPSAKSSMYQGFVTRATPHGPTTRVEVTLRSPGRAGVQRYVVEILSEQGPMLSVPNEAIIEEADAKVVYVQQAEGQFAPRSIKAGIQGELYTQVVSGVIDGEQVVTFGSFFIDAENKLKGLGETPSAAPAR